VKASNPPRLAVWLLEEFGPKVNREALIGDLNEAMAQGRSSAWYWRQVLRAIRWRRVLYKLLIFAAWSWWMTRPGMWLNSPLVSRPLDMAIFMAAFLAATYVPAMLRGRLRAELAVLIVVFFCWLYRGDYGAYSYDIYYHYTTLGLFFLFRLIFFRKAPAPAPYHLTLLELVYSDPEAERQRLMEKLHLAMLQETNPDLRQAYAESIAALRSNETPAAKATE
jgi:hypothetical protein